MGQGGGLQMTIIYFIIALGVLVFIHEFGHFIIAKKQGIGVEKFSMGFGPKLFSFQRGETTYIVSALPFGGYVKLMGEEPTETKDTEKKEKDPKSYSDRPIHQRFFVVFAGPFMNLLLASLLMPLVFFLGRMEPIFLDQKPVVISVKKESTAAQSGFKKGDQILAMNDKEVANWREILEFVPLHAHQEINFKIKRDGNTVSIKATPEESPDTHAGVLGVEPTFFIGNEAVVDEVSPHGPADQSGLKGGDEVVQINGAPVESWTDMSEKVGAGGGKSMQVTVRRGQDLVTVSVTPQFDEGMKKWLLGIRKNMERRSDLFVKKRYTVSEAFVKGTEENGKLAKLTFTVLGRLVTGRLSYKTLGGPIRIAQASAAAAKSGLSDFLYFLSFLSLQLGVLNLLPIPALDGGHLLFFGIETAQRRPASPRVRQVVDQVGFFLLIFLMLMVTLNDVNSVWGFKEIFQRVKNIF